MPSDFSVKGSDQFRKLARDLKDAGEVDLRKSMTKRLNGAIKPLVPKMRAAIRSLPSGDQDNKRSKRAIDERPRGLRDATARGVQVKVTLAGSRAGARIRIDPRHFPPGQKALPKFLDGTIPAGRWKHPIYGTDKTTVQETHPFFDRTVRIDETRIRNEIGMVLEDVSSQLMRGK